MCPKLVTLKSSRAPNACWRWILQLDFEALCRTLKSWAAPQIRMLQSIMLLMLLVISDCNSAFLYVLTIYNIWLDPLNMIRILHFMKPGDLNDITVSRILHFLQCARIIRKLDITAAQWPRCMGHLSACPILFYFMKLQQPCFWSVGSGGHKWQISVSFSVYKLNCYALLYKYQTLFWRD